MRDAEPSSSPWLSELSQSDAVPNTTLELPGQTHICIIGAGMTGASLAYHLSLLGKPSVVLDARYVSGGASGRNGGILWSIRWIHSADGAGTAVN